MGSFGENLRREREMRGVTLEEISAATKIGIRFLKSIEDEEFSKLPGGIFSRSFVRSYARYLGLDEDPLLAEYQLAAKAKGEEDVSSYPLPKPYPGPQQRSRPTLPAIVAAVVLLAAGYGLWRYSRRSMDVPMPSAKQQASLATSSSGSKPQATPNSSTPPPVSAPTPGAEPKDSRAANGGTTPASQATPQALVPASSPPPNPAPKAIPETDYNGSLVLQVAATERSWVAIDADGKTIMQGILNPNEVKTFKAKNGFDFLTGNAQGVILTLNGETLKPLGRQGEVKSVHLTRDDLKKQTSP
jgi:cytoskeleton protein RodZ